MTNEQSIAVAEYKADAPPVDSPILGWHCAIPLGNSFMIFGDGRKECLGHHLAALEAVEEKEDG